MGVAVGGRLVAVGPPGVCVAVAGPIVAVGGIGVLVRVAVGGTITRVLVAVASGTLVAVGARVDVGVGPTGVEVKVG